MARARHWRVGDEMCINVLDSRRFVFDKLSSRVERSTQNARFRESNALLKASTFPSAAECNSPSMTMQWPPSQAILITR